MPALPSNPDATNPFCAARLRPGTIDFVFEAGQESPTACRCPRGQRLAGPNHRRPRHRQVDPAGRLDAGHRRPRPGGQVHHPRGRTTTPAARVPRSRCGPRRPGSGRGRRRRTTPSLEPPAPEAILPDAWRGPRRGVASLGHTCPISTKRPSTRPGPGGWSSGFKTAFRRGSKSETSSQRLARHQGNLREALFDLYDLYEERG